jgi:hypothetical protein
MASKYKKGELGCSKTSLITIKPISLNQLPDEIIEQILSNLGPDELYFTIAHVSERLNILAKDVLRKTNSYTLDSSSDISAFKEVRSTRLLDLGLTTLKILPHQVFKKYKILKSVSEIGPLSILSEARQVSRDVHCVMKSGCYQ